MLVPESVQARLIKIYSHNGTSRRVPKPTTPIDTAPAPAHSMVLGGLTWASVNVDNYQTFAVKPDTVSKFYQFNRTKAWAATDSKASWVTSINENSDWLPDSSPCPNGWRLPTKTEYQALISAGSTWVEVEMRGNAVSGCFFGTRHADCSLPNDMSGCVFFPAIGLCSSLNGTFTPIDDVYAWSSTQVNSINANSLLYSKYSNYTNGSTKTYGYPVRCVK